MSGWEIEIASATGVVPSDEQRAAAVSERVMARLLEWPGVVDPVVGVNRRTGVVTASYGMKSVDAQTAGVSGTSAFSSAVIFALVTSGSHVAVTKEEYIPESMPSPVELIASVSVSQAEPEGVLA